MPTDSFPVTLLQRGQKVTSEPPRGIKANTLRTYGGFQTKLVEGNKKGDQWKRLLFGLSFFHALV